MKISDTIYYTPHQVASFFSISKDTLLFYDKIGLFSPALRKENGYRYYSASQLNELDTILTLKDLGIPLSSIKEAVGEISATSFLSLLENEENSILAKIDELKVHLGIVRSIKDSINEACNAEKGRLYKAYYDSRPMIKVPIEVKGKEETSDAEWQKAYSTLMASADCKAIINIGSIVRLDEARLYHGAICREVYATCAKPLSDAMPGGLYAYMFFSGPLDNLSFFYKKFFASLKEEALKPLGDIYEELSISNITTRDEKDHVTKLMVQVCPGSSI